MSFYKSALLLLALCSTALAADEVVDELMEKSQSIVNEANGAAAELLKDAQKVDSLTDADWMRGAALSPSPRGGSQNETAQQRAWQQIMDGTEGAVGSVDQGPPRPPVPEDVMYVYISLSMPEETIRGLFLQALADKEIRSVVFVLRGWHPPGPSSLVSRLNKLFPDAQKLRDLPNVQIDPTLFSKQAVERVPTFTTKDTNGRWGSVIGSTSIKDAVQRIEANRYDGQVIGHTYEIEEPDILALIKERIAKVDWEKQVERTKGSVLTKTTTGIALPAALTDDSYLVDLTVVNNRELRGANGEVFAPTGASVNPFDYMTTKRRYVFFDANDPKQVAQAERWRQENDYTTMITTVPMASVELRKAVIERLKQPVHEINRLLIERFDLKAVPAIAYQEGKMLRVDVVAVHNGLRAKNTGDGQ